MLFLRSRFCFVSNESQEGCGYRGEMRAEEEPGGMEGGKTMISIYEKEIYF